MAGSCLLKLPVVVVAEVVVAAVVAVLLVVVAAAGGCQLVDKVVLLPWACLGVVVVVVQPRKGGQQPAMQGVDLRAPWDCLGEVGVPLACMGAAAVAPGTEARTQMAFDIQLFRSFDDDLLKMTALHSVGHVLFVLVLVLLLLHGLLLSQC